MKRTVDDGWCILRTSGAKTLPLAESLTKAGFDVWTPKRTFRRALRVGRKNERKVEIDAPILPTFVFASAHDLHSLAVAASAEDSPHPSFSIFRYLGRIPLVGHASVVGLRDAERAATEAIQMERDEDVRREARRVRIAMLKTEQARRKALRSERRNFSEGASVTVAEMPALTGMTGVVLESDGKSALVWFGGLLTMNIEAWRLSAHDVYTPSVAA
jgi:hypothetical protein